MATLEELEQQSVRIAVAEEDAVAALVEGMRCLAVGLPDGSRLAGVLATEAKGLEPWGSTGQHTAGGKRDQLGVQALSIMNMASHVIEERA